MDRTSRPGGVEGALRDQVAALEASLAERMGAVHQSRQSEDRLRTLLENSPDSITVLDEHGTILYVNRTMAPRRVEDVVGTSLVTYMAETPAEYVNVAGKFVAAFGTWEARARGAPAKVSGRGSVGDRTLGAMERFIRRGEVDRSTGVLEGPGEIGDGRTSGDR